MVHHFGRTNYRSYQFVGDNVEELIEQVLPFVTPSKRDFYQKSIREDLVKYKRGWSVVSQYSSNIGIPLSILFDKENIVTKNDINSLTYKELKSKYKHLNLK